MQHGRGRVLQLNTPKAPNCIYVCSCMQADSDRSSKLPLESGLKANMSTSAEDSSTSSRYEAEKKIVGKCCSHEMKVSKLCLCLMHGIIIIIITYLYFNPLSCYIRCILLYCFNLSVFEQ